MPHNLDAEKAVLGCILTDPETLKDAAVRLNFDGAFYSASHQTIYSTIIVMANSPLEERQAIDHIVLEVEVRRGHRFGDRGIGREMQDCDGLVGVKRGS